MAVGAVVARILTQYSDKGSKAAQRDINKLGQKFDDFSRRTVRAFGIATAAVGAFAVKVGKDAVQAAIADQKSQVLLANSLRNTTGATTTAISAVEDYVSKLQVQVGVADDELRPALSRLAAVTGDVASAQQLLSLALNVSASSGADLSAATTAITRAFQGNFKGLQKLVPSIDTTIVKSKDLAAIFREVEKATQGAAGARAGTLEYRLAILRIRYSEILETLGYALLPVLEQFSKTLTSDILPKISRWVELNKKGLAEGLKNAAEAALELLKSAFKVGAWFVENYNTIKNFAILLASIWATGKIYSFITAIGKVSLAFQGMKAAAVGAGAASAAATAGSAGAGAAFLAGARALGIVGVGAAAIGGLTYGLSKISPRENAKRKAAAERMSGSAKAQDYNAKFQAMVSRSQEGRGLGSDFNSMKSFYDSITNAQNALNAGKKKELSIQEKITAAIAKKYKVTVMTADIEAQATAAAINANLKRQAAIAKSSPTVSLATQNDGSSNGSPISNNSSSNITVNVNTPFVTPDDVVVDITNRQNNLARRGGRFMATAVE